MTTMMVQLRSIPDTQSALGWADGHTIVVDRPDAIGSLRRWAGATTNSWRIVCPGIGGPR
jgi:hypothetical protein